MCIDAVVLVDGGTDILMRGDEAGLGTPVEDMTGLAAVAGIDLPIKLVTCLGFGIEAYHGVNHAQLLENLAALDRDGACLGALSIPGASREAALYRDAVADAQADAATAQHCQRTDRRRHTRRLRRRAVHPADHGSALFVNPLMAIYFTVDLDALAARSLYLDRLENTYGMRQVATRITPANAERGGDHERGRATCFTDQTRRTPADPANATDPSRIFLG